MRDQKVRNKYGLRIKEGGTVTGLTEEEDSEQDDGNVMASSTNRHHHRLQHLHGS